HDLTALLSAGRAMNLVWSLATGVLVFAWTRRLFGLGGAWIALTFFVFCPTMLAHGPLATSDMCMTFFMLASVGAYARHLRDFRPATLLLSAATLGLAFVAKYSAVLLVFMLGALLLARALQRKPLTWRGRAFTTFPGRLGVLAGSAAVHVIGVVAIIWFFHGFQAQPVLDPSLPVEYTRPW